MKASLRSSALVALPLLLVSLASTVFGHGTVVDPISRVYRVYLSNPENPNFPLAAQAVAIDGAQSYYTWNELSRNIAAAVQAGLPPGYDYSPWVPDGQIASGGRVDPQSSEYPRTYAGLDQESPDWPATPVTAGETIEVDFLATAPHDPSVWDVWMTTPDWDAATALRWSEMEFLGRPTPILIGGHYFFDLQIPSDRVGHHVLWVAWQRDDPVGEVFFSTSDLMIESATSSSDESTNQLGIELSNYPDPFADHTSLRFSLSAPGHVTLRIFDIAGRFVRTLIDSDTPAGLQSRIWDGTDEGGVSVANGAYLVRLEHTGGVETKRVLFVR